jgi:hypothetical protein
MAEVGGAGVPISYCLLSTTSSITKNKQSLALGSWCKALRDRFNIRPWHIHTDYAFGEIDATQECWRNAKHGLCFWHCLSKPCFIRSSYM